MRILIVFLLILSLAAPSVAEDGVDAQARELFDTIMSPYCPGRTLSACPSDDARVLRDQIRDSLGKGDSPEKIRADLKSFYGDGISGKPEGERGSYLGYLVPTLIVILGGIVIAYVVLKGKKGESKLTATTIDLSAIRASQIEDELMRRIKGE